MFFNRHKTISPSEALPGREESLFAVPERHAVLGTPLEPPFPEGMSTAVFGLGCFWGAEREFWQLDGVYTTAVGYAGGFTPNPTYREVCSGRTGHAEVVRAKTCLAVVIPYPTERRLSDFRSRCRRRSNYRRFTPSGPAPPRLDPGLLRLRICCVESTHRVQSTRCGTLHP